MSPLSRKRRRRWLALTAFALVVVAILSTLPRPNPADAAFAKAIREVEATDPRWRLEDIEADRPQVPDAENSALRIAAIAFPHRWPDRLPEPATAVRRPRLRGRGEVGPDPLHSRVLQVPRADRLSGPMLAEVRAELASLAPQVRSAHELARFPRGRHDIGWQRNPINTRFPDTEQVRRVTFLLVIDAVDRIENGDRAGFLESAQALHHVNRSLDGVPFRFTQVIAMAGSKRRLELLERWLAHDEPGVEVLLPIMQTLADDERAQHAGIRLALRGERATQSRLLEMLASGELSRHEANFVFGEGSATWWTDHARVGGRDTASRASLLNLHTRIVTAHALPRGERREAMRRLDGESDKLRRAMDLQGFGDHLGDEATKLVFAEDRMAARLRCARVALAVEAHRVRHGDWPDTLDRLVPDWLVEVPTDPLGDLPLRYTRTPTGVRVSVGEKEGDIGFELWHPSHREPSRVVP